MISETNWPAAKKPIEELIRRYPAHTGGGSAWLLLAQAHRELGETNAERAALEKFAAIDAETVEAYDRLMEIGAQTGDWKLVQTNALRWLAVNPLLPRPHDDLARAAENLQDDAIALRANRVLLALNPADPAQVHFRLARLLHKAKDPEARRQALQALEEAPRFRDAHELLRALRRE